jgi:tetratricopeptide (TPR) repeat protein
LWAALTTLDDREGRMMAEPAPGLRTLPHAVFLERMASAVQASSEARLGRAAFVALRLVDLLAHDREALHPDAFHYQYVATQRACRDLPADRTETTHLVGLVRSAADAFQGESNNLALPALFAYAHFLEDEMRLEQALDVLETMNHIGSEALSVPDAIALRLRTARVLRKLNQFDAAERWYDEAGGLATVNRDTRSELLSRIGRANVLTARGNLAESERVWHGVVSDAEALGDREAQAHGHHGLAVALSTGGQPADAVLHAWRAFELYSDELARMRALGDVGTMLLLVGDAASAARALSEVVRRGATHDVLDNATIALMDCASFRRDRVGFERWRERCEPRRSNMPPNILATFHLTVGIGRARLGQVERAEEALAKALSVASSAGLHELEFRIERIRAGLEECLKDPECAAQFGDESRWGGDAVREVSASLAQFEP